MYRLLDTNGKIIARRFFATWLQAHNYRCLMGRLDWTIKEF